MKIIRIFLLVLISIAGSASASTIYRAVGGTCTDSAHYLLSSSTNPGDNTVGPKVCADDIVLELTLSHSYVPGSTLLECSGTEAGSCATSEFFVEKYHFTDGAFSDSLDFLAVPFFAHSVRGSLPVNSGLTPLLIRTPYSALQINLDGTWSLGVESTRVAGDCAIGSIEGPTFGTGGGFCRQLGSGYSSVGAIAAFERVPEPASLALLALGLSALPFTRRRYHQVSTTHRHSSR